MPVTDTIFKSLAYFQNSVTLPVCLCQRVPRYMYTLINKFTISRIIAFAVILFFFFLISILTLENFDVISLDRPYSKKYYILECFYYDLLIILFPLASLFVYFKFNRDAVCIFVFVQALSYQMGDDQVIQPYQKKYPLPFEQWVFDFHSIKII